MLFLEILLYINATLYKCYFIEMLLYRMLLYRDATLKRFYSIKMLFLEILLYIDATITFVKKKACYRLICQMLF